MTSSEGSQPKIEQAAQVAPVAKQDAPPADDIWKNPLTSAVKLAGSTGAVKGSARQIIDAGLLGMCVVFFVALLGQKQLDSSLTGAAIAFAITVPLLVYGYLSTSSKIIKNVPGWRILVAIQIGAWIGEGVGEFTAALGLYFVLAHLAPSAASAYLITAIVALVGIPVLSAIGALIYAIRRLRKQGQVKPEEQQTSVPPEQLSAG